jgi:hypothetical protein
MAKNSDKRQPSIKIPLDFDTVVDGRMRVKLKTKPSKKPKAKNAKGGNKKPAA